MGQIKRIRKKYKTPSHPWQRDRIIEEKDILREYGLKNKKEIWKFSAKLRSSRDQVKKIIANIKPEQSAKERKQLLDKLIKFGIISKDSKIEDILELKTKDFLERRLQTIVFKKRLARSMKQARQFISHGHITINNKKITVPSYLVSKEEESKIEFRSNSPISKIDHPERMDLKKLEKEKKEKIIKKEETKEEKEKIVAPKEDIKEKKVIKKVPKEKKAKEKING